MSTEQNLFLTSVYQSKNTPVNFVVPRNERVIRIVHFKMTATRWGDDDDYDYNDICTLADYQVVVEVPEFLLLSRRHRHVAFLVGVLTRMKVPIVEQPSIIDKVFIEVERADNPQLAIACFIKDITIFPRMVNIAYRSECFEGVRIDSLEDTDRRKQCVICRESLDHVEDIEEGIDRSQLVRLPCSHLYHGDCLSKWLPMSALCPLCRYALPVEQTMPFVEQTMPVVEQIMPVVEQAMPVVEQTAEPVWPQLHWPMLLTASAGGILTAILVCRLWKKTQV
ncbi:PREDICTED: uncharacterized protein LOC101298420 [Fragaria vesca subsp. vesca]|uniref:uncharacterized protein LOC101298420 n=1 Tax=Fragaria vesca subsp. vesca TaxID=101020 RepID=UPI0002C31436|nr:PREDICTED: uncharacterized protein LOC101298420 [Fragaria vesca subsp. vesca]